MPSPDSFHGIPVERRETVPPSGAVLVCVSVAELPDPYVPSELRDCYGCGTPLWASKAVLRHAGPGGFTFLCQPCGLLGMALNGVESVFLVEAAEREVDEYLAATT